MNFAWLKTFMPRSLYGRAALILVLPVVTLQLVVTIIFLQRHFEGVTEQLTTGVREEIGVMLAQADWSDRDAALNSMTPLAEPMDYELRWPADDDVPASDVRRIYDLSGIVVMRELRDRELEFPAILLPDDRHVIVYVTTPFGPLEVSLNRERVSASNPHQLIVNMILFSLIMTPIAFVYLRNQLRPITRLADASEAFGRGRVVPYSPSGATEVRAAGSAFLDMRSRIERHIEQRTLLLSGVSHDLRTPLTRLKLGLEMSDEEGAEHMRRDIQEMEKMLDAFLEFARGDAEAGDVEAVDPAALLRMVVEDAQRVGQQVVLGEIEDDGPVMLRPVAIRRAVENLLANAGRYGTRAEVSVLLEANSLCIRVEDDGPGIPDEDRDKALRAFVRLDKARNQNTRSGVGLGLAVTSDIARAHGGVLRLGRSQRLGGLQADLIIAR